MRQYPDVNGASVFLRAMKSKTDEQLVAAAGHWLKGLRNEDLRAECRDQFEEWVSEEEPDEDQLRITKRLWHSMIANSRR